ncbi:MAG: glycosyl hydrolase, partial [Leeuwenhoekiella sp.]|nr:glycosyl hydrolase [Leeuwenhoekiella sp.]
MKKFLRITLKALGILVAIALIVGVIGYLYVSNTFLSFEDDYAENKDLKELTLANNTFIDRNGNGSLDVYEDDRNPNEMRVADALKQMTIEEKIHLLKGSGLASAMGIREDGIPGVVGTIVATPRLGLPEVNLSDGPAGLRIEPIREGIDRT